MQEGADFEHSAGGRVDSGAGEEGTLGLDGVDGEGRYVVEMPCGEGVLGCLWRIVTMGVGLLHGRLDVIGWWSSFSRVFRWGINNQLWRGGVTVRRWDKWMGCRVGNDWCNNAVGRYRGI